MARKTKAQAQAMAAAVETLTRREAMANALRAAGLVPTDAMVDAGMAAWTMQATVQAPAPVAPPKAAKGKAKGKASAFVSYLQAKRTEGTPEHARSLANKAASAAIVQAGCPSGTDAYRAAWTLYKAGVAPALAAAQALASGAKATR